MKIQEIIQQKLSEIEEKENVTVLHAVESGSRAWGFASPDSDYDVRFVYVRREEDYLRLGKQRDVIEWQLDETLDINGWDLQKALRLMYDSNPTLFEWCFSPVVYRTSAYWKTVCAAAGDYFSPKAGCYHYLNMAKHNYQAYLCGETVRLKKYFYVLRPLLACRWILERGTVPPVAFETLREAMLPDELRETVDELVRRKMQTPELGEEAPILLLHDWLTRSIAELEASAADILPEKKPDWTALDRLFLDGLRGQ